MTPISISAVKEHVVSADGTVATVTLQTKYVGEIAISIPADCLDGLIATLKKAKSAILAKDDKAPGKLTVAVPKKWLVTKDLQDHDVVLLVFDHQTEAQAGYAIDPGAAKEMAVGLVKNADAVMAHKAEKGL